uniref:Uncharacterized protein n=1 Tax=Triticum urartu TaxID=4572 RepID=A0A8R7Q4E0_TRIUA
MLSYTTYKLHQCPRVVSTKETHILSQQKYVQVMFMLRHGCLLVWICILHRRMISIPVQLGACAQNSYPC